MLESLNIGYNDIMDDQGGLSFDDNETVLSLAECIETNVSLTVLIHLCDISLSGLIGA